MNIFFSGPLTNLQNPEATKAFYTMLHNKAVALGHNSFWAFLSGTDPIRNPEVNPKEVYLRDINALDASDVMVAYMGEPSTGTGIEIEHAHKTNKPVIIMYEQGRHVSRMLRGCPAIVKEIAYSNPEEAANELFAFLSSMKQ